MQTIKRRTATRVAGLGVGALVLAVFVYFVGVNSVVEVLSQVNPVIILFMVSLQLLGLAFYATAWYVLIRAAGYRLPFLACQGITFASIFAAYTTPSGIFLEVARCLLGARESGMRLGESAATVILHRILYVVGFLATTALAVSALIVGGQIKSSMSWELALLPAVAIVAVAILLILSLNPTRLKPFLDRALKLFQPVIKLVQKEARTEGKTDRFLIEYNQSFRRMLASKRHVVVSFAANLGDWTCSVLVLWVVLLSVGSSVSIWIVVVTMAIGRMIQMTPIAVPGMLGIYEAAITTSLSLFGVPVALAGSAAILTRIVTFWLDLPVTGVAAYHYGFKVLTQESRASTALAK